MKLDIKKVTEKIKNKKISWIIILSYIVLLVYPLTSFSENLHSLEKNIMLLDLSRSSIIFIFDSVLLLFIIIFPLAFLLLLIMKRRLRVIRQMMVVVLILVILITPILGQSTFLKSLPERETPLVSKVFIITFDGTRADAFWKYANWIIQRKDQSVWARNLVCTYPTVTYPNHVSLVTGTWPQIHGTESNAREYRSVQFMLRVYREPRVVDVFDVAEDYDILTAVFTPASTLAGIIGGEKTRRIINVGHGHETMQAVINYINNNKAEIESKGFLAWIHLVDPDETLHQYGVDSIQYRSAIRAMADEVGSLYDAINSLGWDEDSVIIVTADHGAVGNRHYGVWPPLVAEIPFWMWGKPVKKGYELGGGRIIDIAPTVAFILGIPAPASSVGAVLYDAFEEDYVRSIRGSDVNLNKLAFESLNYAVWNEIKEIYFWGILTLTMIWIMTIEIIYLARVFKELAIEEKKVRRR